MTLEGLRRKVGTHDGFRNIVRALICLMIIGLVISGRAAAQSTTPMPDAGFACDKAHGVDERIICADPKLREADKLLNQKYKALVASDRPAVMAAAIRNDQRAWIKSRNQDCGVSRDTEVTAKDRRAYIGCFLNSYETRIADLNQLLAMLSRPPSPINERPAHKLAIIPDPIGARPAPPPPPLSRAERATGAHGCVVFGAVSGGKCTEFSDWKGGTWLAPDGVTTVHVLLIGAGGGGGATIERGIGGTGGGSGQVVVKTVTVNGTPIETRIGQPGLGGISFRQSGSPGSASSFGADTAAGGGAGNPSVGGTVSVADGGNSGGGGAGGGSYQQGSHAGAGGAGGTSGGDGEDGQPGIDPAQPVGGTSGGKGHSFPAFTFSSIEITAGAGGKGGSYGADSIGYGGGGGGGGGGVLINSKGGEAADGATGPGPRSGINVGGGKGGAGFGAGGGGGGNYVVGAHGGDGAAGLIYIEW